jgi:hypothetical protein
MRAAALSEQPQVVPDPLQGVVRTDAVTPRAKDEHRQITASFEYNRSRQERVIHELMNRMELHEHIQREAELKTVHESPLSTMLNLTRFLTSRGYKRADGSPLIDLTF